jgi:hypothetical protein
MDFRRNPWEAACKGFLPPPHPSLVEANEDPNEDLLVLVSPTSSEDERTRKRIR